MVGGRDYATRPFNLATQGQRQPGSSIKPFILAAGAEEGLRGRLAVAVAQARLHRARAPRGKEKFVVNNFESKYAGTQTLAGGLTYSDNSVFVGGRHLGRDEEDRRAGRAHGHPHAGLVELRDDARRPQAGRHAARHGPRLRDASSRAAGASAARSAPSDDGPVGHRRRSTRRAARSLKQQPRARARRSSTAASPTRRSGS